MVGRQQPGDGDVMQQARHDHLLAEPVLPRYPGALQQVHPGDLAEAQQEEVPQRGALGHLRQRGIVSHHEDGVRVAHLGQQGALAGGCGRADDCRGRRHDDAAPAVNGVIKRFTDPVLKTGVAQGSWQFMGQYPAGRWCLGGSGHAHSSLRRCGLI
jgi:hypothetical protein